MSEMVERVAIALFCGDSHNPHDPFEWKSMITERGREYWRSQARIAIEAMREPTVEMVEQASHLVEGDTAVQYTQNTYEVWRNMTDAALGKIDA